MEGILLLCESTSVAGPLSVCVEVLEYSLQLVEALKERQSNDKAEVGRAKSILKAR